MPGKNSLTNPASTLQAKPLKHQHPQYTGKISNKGNSKMELKMCS